MSAKLGKLSKLEVARRHLGAALQLFIDDLDPVSVHTLASAGAEVAEHLARDCGASPFVNHALMTNADMTEADYRKIANQFYNAFKHANERSGRARDDAEILQAFDDRVNDAHLLVAWQDLIAATGIFPIEVQVFQVWFYACYPEKLADGVDVVRFTNVFTGITAMDRGARKQALRDKIAWAKTNTELMLDPRTDPLPLLLPRRA